MRKAGLLMPVSALPSDYGVGDFGRGSREFIDIMKECGLHIWQILPMNPLGYGNSPYQPYSSFAGDEIYLDLDALSEEGLLNRKPAPFRREEARVDHEKVRRKPSRISARILNMRRLRSRYGYIPMRYS